MTPKADLEKIIRKGKAFGGGTSTTKSSISDDFHCPIGTPTPASHFVSWPSIGVSRSLKFGSVPVEFSPPSLALEGESLVTPLSPEVVPWFKPNNSKYFHTSGFTTPPSITTSTEERETFVPLSPEARSPNSLRFPFPHVSSVPVSL